jgi:hypothetical protein
MTYTSSKSVDVRWVSSRFLASFSNLWERRGDEIAAAVVERSQCCDHRLPAQPAELTSNRGIRSMTFILPPTSIIRVSRGDFDPARFAEVARMTRDTGTYLIPATIVFPVLPRISLALRQRVRWCM